MTLVTLTEELVEAISAEYGALRKLNLSCNGLRDISNISRLASLEKLNLSTNDLVDIRALSYLPLLTHLDLSQNQIISLDALRSLHRLESLDLSSNAVHNIEALNALTELPALKALCLQNNPLCDSVGYPYIVFTLLPRLETLNGIRKQDILKSSLSAAAGEARREGSVLRRAATHAVTSTAAAAAADAEVQKERFHLDAMLQLDALTKAFESQEQVLSARLSAGSADQPASFPYASLLQHWRTQVVKCTAEKLLLQRQLRSAAFEEKSAAARIKLLVEEKEAAVEGWKERCSAASVKVRSLESRAMELELELEQSARRDSSSSASMHMQGGQLVAVRDAVLACRASVDKSYFSSQLLLLRGVEKLRAMEERVLLAAERVKFVCGVNAMNEIKLRNSAAALEAEKILLRLSNDGVCKAAEEDDGNVAGGGLAPLQSQGREGPELIALRPETESLLRLIFRQLDPEDTGLVLVDTLLAVLSGEGSEESGGSEQSTVASILRGGLGAEGMRRLLRGLRAMMGDIDQGRSALLSTGGSHDPESSQGEDEKPHEAGSDEDEDRVRVEAAVRAERTVTWGEFLLLLLPSIHRTPLLGLTSRDERGLRSLGLLGDEDWGLLPLQVKSQAAKRLGAAADKKWKGLTEDAASASLDIFSLEAPALAKEVRRLCGERAWLLKRLQDAERSVERRAQEIKAYFASEIKRAEMVEGRMNRHIKERNEHVEALQKKILSQEQHTQELVARSDSALKSLREQLDLLADKLKEKEDELEGSLEKREEEEKSRLERLEAENAFLRRDLNKTDIKCKALQRDIARLQSTSSNALETNMSVRAEFEAAQLEISRLQEDRALLNEKIVSLETRLAEREQSEEQERGQAMSTLYQHDQQWSSSARRAAGGETAVDPAALRDLRDGHEGGGGTRSAQPAGTAPGKSSNLIDLKISKLSALTERLMRTNAIPLGNRTTNKSAGGGVGE